jgi:hypothetical protein
MTLDQFVNTYNGTTVGSGQCVALINSYEAQVLGLTPQAVGDAHQYYDDYYTNPFLYNNFNRYTYNGSNKPEKGDIVVWNTNVAPPYGHVDIAYSYITSTNFTSFSQNWGTPLECSLVSHSYANVLGWLRAKNIPPTPTGDIKPSKFNFILFNKNRRK